jgi:hypothetical protein
MGNWINKEWSQQVNLNSDDESNKENCGNATDNSEKSKSKIVRKKVSSLLNNYNVAENNGDYTRVNTVNGDSTPVTNNSKVLMSDFDPRSPSSDIVR